MFPTILGAAMCASMLVLPAAGAAPVNDMFADRIAVSGLPLRLIGDTTGATVEPEEPTEIQPGFGRRLEHSVWYSWTADKSGMVGIYFGLDLIRELRIYAGNSWADLARVPLVKSPNQTGPSRNISFTTDWTFRAEAGASYHIAVYEAGLFTLDLMERPDNDFFADRIEITPSGGRLPGTTTNATYEYGESGVTEKTVWYGWMPDFNGPAVAMLFDGSGPMRLDGFKGDTLTALQGLGSSAVGDTLLLPFTVEAGQPYAVRVSGRPSSQPFRLFVERAPTNDNFASAIPLPDTSALLEGTTWGTTVEAGEPFLTDVTASTGTAWWKWVPPASGLLRIKAGDFHRRVTYAVFRGTNLSSLAPVKYFGNHAGDGYPDEYLVVAGKTYYVRIQDSPIFRFEFELFPRPANDDFARREVLTGLTGATSGDNFLASRQGGEPLHGGFRAGHSVWWSWTAPLSGHLFVATIGSDFNNVIAAYTGDNQRRLQPVADNRFSYWTGLLGFPVTAGTPYQIAVDGISERDTEDGRIRTTRGNIEFAFDFTTLRLATPTNGSAFAGPANVELSLATPAKDVDGTIASAEFYTAVSAYDVQSIGVVEAAPFSLTATNLTPGVYVVAAVVTNHLSQPRVVPPVAFFVRPPNDSFSESTALASNPGLVRGWIGAGTWESWEKRPGPYPPNTGSSWWVWTAPETGVYHLEINTLTSMVAYRGSTPSQLRPVGRFQYGNSSFNAVAGVTYHLQAFSSARMPEDGVDTTIEFILTR